MTARIQNKSALREPLIRAAQARIRREIEGSYSILDLSDALDQITEMEARAVLSARRSGDFAEMGRIFDRLIARYSEAESYEKAEDAVYDEHPELRPGH